jgi:hypothetical protein
VINTNKPGEYQFSYECVNSAGLSAVGTRNIIVRGDTHGGSLHKATTLSTHTELIDSRPPIPSKQTHLRNGGKGKYIVVTGGGDGGGSRGKTHARSSGIKTTRVTAKAKEQDSAPAKGQSDIKFSDTWDGGALEPGDTGESEKPVKPEPDEQGEDWDPSSPIDPGEP